MQQLLRVSSMNLKHKSLNYKTPTGALDVGHVFPKDDAYEWFSVFLILIVVFVRIWYIMTSRNCTIILVLMTKYYIMKT